VRHKRKRTKNVSERPIAGLTPETRTLTVRVNDPDFVAEIARRESEAVRQRGIIAKDANTHAAPASGRAEPNTRIIEMRTVKAAEILDVSSEADTKPDAPPRYFTPGERRGGR
jgi:hypothetical protein